MSVALIIEDNAAFRKTLKTILASRIPRLTVHEAEDGVRAMQIVEHKLPDVIIMDIRLPGENGLILTKKIKTVFANAVVIVLTTFDLPEYRHAAYQIGANHFFSKGSPNIDEIVALVESYLPDAAQEVN